MRVTFRKSDDGRVCSWVALRPPRTEVPGPAMAAGADVPHDLATFVIEAALGIEHGFWGCVADGATFRTLGRRRTPRGRAVIDRHLAALEDAEARVNETFFAWRRGEPTPTGDALDEVRDEWCALPGGGALVREWERPTERARGTRRRT
jgi:hypothetical protein